MWQRVFDEESNDYYYWNSTTNKTQWEVPQEYSQEKQAIPTENVINQAYNLYKNTDYSALESYPAAVTNDYSKAFNQMSFYFDVEKYQNERNLNRNKTVKKLSKAEIQRFKAKKLEKKRKSLIQRMGPDL